MAARKLSDARLPPAKDERWIEWSKPVLAFVRSGPRDWYALRAFSREIRCTVDTVRQMLAWLNLMGLVRWDGRCWRRT